MENFETKICFKDDVLSIGIGTITAGQTDRHLYLYSTKDFQ